MKKILLFVLLLTSGLFFTACEKEDEDPYGNSCEAAAGTICTTIGTDAMSAPATWRRIDGTPNRFRIDFQITGKNIEIDMYSNDTIPYSYTYPVADSRAANTAVITYFDGTNEWIASEGESSIDNRANNTITGRFQGKLTKVGSTETMYIKASSFNAIPRNP
jgi:hypothetical protein